MTRDVLACLRHRIKAILCMWGHHSIARLL